MPSQPRTRPLLVAPSLLAADFCSLGSAVDAINASQADWFHLDVMDGSFVDSVSFGQPVVASLAKRMKLPFEVHLMVCDPERHIDAFHALGASIITVHAEACPHLHRTLTKIKSLPGGVKAGVALNPHTPVSVLQHVLQLVDVICIMSVDPGAGGQKMLTLALDKIREAKSRVLKAGRVQETIILVDGGINMQTASLVAEAGCDAVVAGSAVFSAPRSGGGPAAAVEALKEAAIRIMDSVETDENVELGSNRAATGADTGAKTAVRAVAAAVAAESVPATQPAGVANIISKKVQDKQASSPRKRQRHLAIVLP